MKPALKISLGVLIFALIGFLLLPRPDHVHVYTVQDRTRQDLRGLVGVICLYNQQNGAAPKSLEDLIVGDVIRTLPTDAWGNRYRYSGTAVSTLGEDAKVGGVGDAQDVSLQVRCVDT